MKRSVKLLTIICCTFQLTLCAQTSPSPAATAAGWKMQPVALQTRWAKEVDPNNVLPEYPRPQMVRNNWQNLNGLWEYAITGAPATTPAKYDGSILVPFPIESALSGVKKAVLPQQRLWYKRTIIKPDVKNNERVLLHFGAVDWQCTVYINGAPVGEHTGGYQAFSFDVTNALKSGSNELVVKVYDPTDQGPNPRGKQVLQPKGIRYTASTGIWQTVWLETVPAVAISSLTFTPDVDGGYLSLTVHTSKKEAGYSIEAVATANGKTAGAVKGGANEVLKLPVRDAHLWSPEDPFLYDLTIRLLHNGRETDKVGSYFGMRKIAIRKDDKGQDRIFLNNRYTYNLGVLDQGFWPDGLHTAPADAALEFDIKAIKSMGFNTIRKHIKIEPARWYYHADKLGMLVWQDMVTCASLEPAAKAAFEAENAVNIQQLHNYPSIICWVLFNEGWSTYDQPRLTKWLQDADPSRLVNGHTGENYGKDGPKNPAEKWANSGMTDIHDYPGPGIAPALPGKARVLGEWGGVGVPVKGHQWNAAEGWGYVKITPAEMNDKYASMVKRLKAYEKEGLSGSIYTEPFDVEIEENGLMTYDREVIKVPLEKLRQIHAPFAPQAASEEMAKTLQVKNADTSSRPDPYRGQFLSILEMEADAKKTGDWQPMTNALSDYLQKGGDRFVPAKISSMAKKVFEGTDDPALLNQALNWMKKVVEAEKNSVTMSTYANLLYKLGQKEDAIRWMDRAENLSPESDQPIYRAFLGKMKNNEHTW